MHSNTESLSNFLKSGGNASTLIQSVNWSETPIGAPAGWPQSLQSALSICINSNFPIAIYWGPELVLLYNDAWSPIAGNKHPWAFGKTALEVWPEIWTDIHPQFEKAFTGIPGGSRDALLPMQRHGYTEECYFDFTFTPIYGESGRVEGIFNAVIETTYRVINERRAAALQRLADAINGLPSHDEILKASTSALGQAKEDVPFFFIYEFQDGKLELKGSSEVAANVTINPSVLNQIAKGDLVHVTDLTAIFDAVPVVHWPETPAEAVFLPMQSNDGKTVGFILGGISARRKFDKEYRSFYESIASLLGGQLNTVASLVVERQRTEALAQLDQKEFFNLFRQAPAQIHVMRGPDHIFEFFHPLAKAFTGGKDFTGKKVRDVLPELEGQGYFEMLDQVYNEGKSFNIPESKANLKNDKGELTEYYFHLTYLPWRDVDAKILGVLQFSFDVTEQAKARLILEEAEYKLQNAIDLAELSTWQIDLLTNFVFYDQRIEQWGGLDAKGAPLETVINSVVPEDRAKVSEAINYAVTVSGVYNAEYRVANQITGEVRHIIAKGKVIRDDENKAIRLSGIARDVTLRKMAQQELERLVALRTKELQEANIELKRSNEDLQQFAYVASHDLQEPLRKIQTFSELAHAKLNDVNAAKVYLDKIDSSAARMSLLIRDVLAYSQANKKEFEPERVDLSEIIENVMNDFELLIQQKNVTIKVGKLPIVQGSKRQFHQLFSNLISNSIKFTNSDPMVEIKHRLVYSVPEGLSIRPAPVYHELSVTDNGIGFDLVYSEQIFQLFSRLQNRNDYGGTGIGLSLCKKIVENHSGAIKAQSEKGKGSTFTIYLPEEGTNG